MSAATRFHWLASVVVALTVTQSGCRKEPEGTGEAPRAEPVAGLAIGVEPAGTGPVNGDFTGESEGMADDETPVEQDASGFPTNLRFVAWRPGDPDPTVAQGVPSEDAVDPWDRRKPTRTGLLRRPIPLPGSFVAHGVFVEEAETIQYVQFGDTLNWDRPAPADDVGGNGYLAIHDMRKVDFDGDGNAEIVVLMEENGGGSASFQYILHFRHKNGRLRYIGAAEEGPAFYNYENYAHGLRRLGRCVEVLADCDKGCGPCDGVPCRSVFAWSEGVLTLAEFAKRISVDEATQGGESAEPGFVHVRDDELMASCNP